METDHAWIWQHPSWPSFSYHAAPLLPGIAALSRLIGAMEVTCRTLGGEVLLHARAHTLLDDALETSAIEGELLRRSSVRSSIRKKLGLPVEQDDSDRRTDALVTMLLDARNSATEPLTEERLFAWQAALFPTGYSGLRKIQVGGYRGRETMQIVSGPLDKERLHYIAPPREKLADDMRQFLAWVNHDNAPDPILKAGIAHLWFIMIHPFDDGNGRVGRAVTDFLLAKHAPGLMQIISFSKHVSQDKKGYYQILEEAGKGDLDITAWLAWYIRTLTTALQDAHWIVAQVARTTQFWERHKDTPLNARQQKVMKRLLETGDRFEGGMTTSKYAGMCKCSKVTASRDLAYLEEQGLLRKRPGGGRSTNYEVRLGG